MIESHFRGPKNGPFGGLKGLFRPPERAVFRPPKVTFNHLKIKYKFVHFIEIYILFLNDRMSLSGAEKSPFFTPERAVFRTPKGPPIVTFDHLKIKCKFVHFIESDFRAFKNKM